jgi:hypothetical protein
MQRDAVAEGLGSVFQGVLQGMQLGQQMAAREQQMRLREAQAQRQELDFQRGAALQDAEIAAGLGGPDIGNMFEQRAKQKRGQRSTAPTAQEFAESGVDQGQIAAGLDEEAALKAQAQQEAGAAKRALSTSEDELMAAEFEDEARAAMGRSRDDVNRRNAEIQQHLLEQSRGDQQIAGSVIPGAEDAGRVPSPGAAPTVSDPDRLSAAMDALGGVRMVGPSRQDKEAVGGDQLGAALLEIDARRAENEAAQARAASLATGLENPAVEFGASAETVLDPGSVARAVLLYKRTGDPSVFEAFGGEVPADLDGIVSRSLDFAREVNRRKIQQFVDEQKSGADEGPGIDYSDLIMNAGITGVDEIDRLNKAINQTLALNPSANPAAILKTFLADPRAAAQHGRHVELGEMRQQLAETERRQRHSGGATGRAQFMNAQTRRFNALVGANKKLSDAERMRAKEMFQNGLMTGDREMMDEAKRIASEDAGEGAQGIRRAIEEMGDGGGAPAGTDRFGDAEGGSVPPPSKGTAGGGGWKKAAREAGVKELPSGDWELPSGNVISAAVLRQRLEN